jgi:hypothetical protein
MARSTALAAVDPAGKAAGDASRKQLTKAGIYNIPAADYHADPAPHASLSAHIAAILRAQSPRHAWLAHPRLNPDFKPEHYPKFDIGRAAHSLLCEGASIFEIIDAPNWKSEAARDERAAVGREGKVALLEHEWQQVSSMVKSARLQLQQTVEAKNAFREGEGERTLLWQEGAIWCRMRPDWMQRQGGRRMLFDYKTTAGNASPIAWSSRTLYDINGDIQAAFYLRGTRQLLREDWEFRFIVQEQNPPYALSVVGLAPSVLELAQQDLQMAMDLWVKCQRRNAWPGYSKRTYYADPPVWRQREVEERHQQASLDRQGKVDPFKLSIALWQP